MPNVQDTLAYVNPAVLSVTVVNDGIAKAIRGLRDGTLSIADFKLVMAMEGRLFEANTGSGASPATFATSFSQLQPSFNLDVPAGTSVIPLPPHLYLQTSAGTLNSVKAASVNNYNGGAGTSAAMTIGPVSTRTDRQVASACKALQLYSGSMAALPANSTQIELWHSGYPFADATGNPIKEFYPQIDCWPWPVLVGPAALQVYVFATTAAPTGYAQYSWIEVPSNRLV